MEKSGTVRLGAATADPYAHLYLSVQPADSVNITLRQTAETSDLQADPDRLYPGIDLKFRLMEEGKYRPELSLGLLSAIGHKRMAGEYLAMSKRYGDLDFTAGLGWGRMGSSGAIGNPLNIASGHFGKNRALDGEMPNGPEDWFTGNAGIFGGVEYFMPVDGLSLKLDWGADRYSAEKTAFDFHAPAPWSAGINYAPEDWLNVGIGILGGEKIMASLSLCNHLDRWPGRNRKPIGAPVLRPHRTDLALPAKMAFDAARQGAITLHDIRRNMTSAWARMDADPDEPMPRQVGWAARHMANHAGKDIEELLVTPEIYGLNGMPVRLMRRDLEQAAISHQGSAPEMWRHASLSGVIPDDLRGAVSENRFTPGARGHPLPRFRFILDTQTSLSEEDSGLLYRASGIAEMTERLSDRWMAGMGVRLNGLDNLGHLDEIRPQAILPVRSNVNAFAGKTVSIDRMYGAWMKSSGHGNGGNWHGLMAYGYLEEMYAGIGGEILYRPYGKTWAIGAEAWEAFKRDPATIWSLGFNGDRLLTGHLKAWYEIPQTDLTLGFKAGRYLAEDIGGTLSLTKSMDNGAKLEAFATATDQADFDPFGGTTQLYSGLRLTLPLGNVPGLPAGSQARFTAAPIGRDTGQSIDSPLPLYDLTEPLSYRHMARRWIEITE
jgi:hypothetical protein